MGFFPKGVCPSGRAAGSRDGDQAAAIQLNLRFICVLARSGMPIALSRGRTCGDWGPRTLLTPPPLQEAGATPSPAGPQTENTGDLRMTTQHSLKRREGTSLSALSKYLLTAGVVASALALASADVYAAGGGTAKPGGGGGGGATTPPANPPQ